jgi:hypothetical protein
MSEEDKPTTFRELYFELVGAVVEFVNNEKIHELMEAGRYKEAFCILRRAALISNADEMSRAGGMVSPEDTQGGKDPWKSMAGRS